MNQSDIFAELLAVNEERVIRAVLRKVDRARGQIRTTAAAALAAWGRGPPVLSGESRGLAVCKRSDGLRLVCGVAATSGGDRTVEASLGFVVLHRRVVRETRVGSRGCILVSCGKAEPLKCGSSGSVYPCMAGPFSRSRWAGNLRMVLSWREASLDRTCGCRRVCPAGQRGQTWTFPRIGRWGAAREGELVGGTKRCRAYCLAWEETNGTARSGRDL
jgi:hypothetical protein